MDRTRTRRPRAGRHDPVQARRPSTGDVVVLIEGVATSIGGVYVLTASVLMSSVVGILVVLVVGFFLFLNR